VGYAELPREPLGIMHDKVRFVEKLCAEGREYIKIEVARAGGRIDEGDRELLLTSEERETIRATGKALNLIEDTGLIDAEEWTEILRIRKTELKKAVMDGSPRGQKTAAWDGLMNRLRAGEHVETKVIERLEVLRRHKNEPDTAASSNGPGAADNAIRSNETA
jgi:hypothetical protein